MNAENQPRPVLYRVADDDPENPNPDNYRPALLVRQWSPDLANLIVFLDGSNDQTLRAKLGLGLNINDGTSYIAWATSRRKGDAVGEWRELL